MITEKCIVRIWGEMQMEQPKQTAELKEGERCVGVIDYSLTLCTCEAASVQSYGVSVLFKGADGLSRSAQVDDISCSRACVEELLHLLTKNTVTPATLHDVVEDFLAAL